MHKTKHPNITVDEHVTTAQEALDLMAVAIRTQDQTLYKTAVYNVQTSVDAIHDLAIATHGWSLLPATNTVKEVPEAVRCQCQRDCHFGDKPTSHPYGGAVALHVMKTPLGTLRACQDCKDTCLSMFDTVERPSERAMRMASAVKPKSRKSTGGRRRG